MDFEAHKEKAIETLFLAYTSPDNAYNCPSTWYVASELEEFNGGKVDVQAYVNHPCHMQLSITDYYSGGKNDWKAPIILASNCQYAPENEEQSLLYLNWIFSNESPWRRLIEEGFHTVEYPQDGRLRGFYFDQSQLKKFPFLLYKNFCIAARVAYEYPDHIRAWKFFVDSGMSKTDAFIMASYAKLKSNGKAFTEPYRNTGHHWPICPNNGDGGHFDYLAWTNGEPKPHYYNPNGCWTKNWDDKYDTGTILPAINASTESGGSYWDEGKINIEDVIKVFEKWSEHAK